MQDWKQEYCLVRVLYLWLENHQHHQDISGPPCLGFQENGFSDMSGSWNFSATSRTNVLVLCLFVCASEWYWKVWMRPWVFRIAAVLFLLLSLAVIWSEVTFFTVTPVLSIFALLIRSASEGYFYFYVEVGANVGILWDQDRRLLLFRNYATVLRKKGEP